MKKNLGSLLLGILLISMTQQTLHAQIIPIAQWNFATDPGGGNPANTSYYTAQPMETTAVDQSVTPFVAPTGVTVSTLILGGAGVFTPDHQQGSEVIIPTTTSSGLAGDIAGGAYEAFTITVDPGYILSLSDMSIATGEYTPGSESGNSYLSSSLTGTTTALGSGANGYGWSSFSLYSHALSPYDVDLTSANSTAGTSFQNLTSANGPITFYIALDIPAYQDNGVQNLVLNGTITSAVPEPSTYALLLGGVALLLGASRRRMISSR